VRCYLISYGKGNDQSISIINSIINDIIFISRTPLLVTVVSFYSFTKLQGQELTASIAFTAITVFNELRSALNSLPETFVDILQALIR
jgi:hypothetical protein